MTAPNPEGVRRCITQALADAGVEGRHVSALNGHLTATGADPKEIASWSAALGVAPDSFPLITATKSMIGHGLGAAGALESVATVLMVHGGFVHGCLNCEDVHPDIAPYAAAIPHEARAVPQLDVMAKAAFGFGDVNAVAIYRRWTE
jgi:3-oxoacyl-(acyl-carrier-protein) synthase